MSLLLTDRSVTYWDLVNAEKSGNPLICDKSIDESLKGFGPLVYHPIKYVMILINLSSSRNISAVYPKDRRNQ